MCTLNNHYTGSKAETVWRVGTLLAQKILEAQLDITPEQETVLQHIANAPDPSTVDDSDSIIEHALLVFQREDTLPAEKVREPAIDMRSSEPSISLAELAKHINDILKISVMKHFQRTCANS
jgi:hypothetical protein